MPPAIICNPLLFISSSFKLPYLRYNIARIQLEERQDSKANTNEKYHNRCTSVQVFALHFAVHLQGRGKNMAAFAGTQQKCMACDKTVYLVDKLTADNRIYHKACFRCHHCRGTLKLSNYSSFEGVLYCRPHYDQLFKRTGSLDKSFEGTPKIVKPEKPVDNENASKVSNLFAGTREKCVGCNKTVYPIEKVSVNGTPYHRSCFKCTHGGCTISPSNYIAHEGKLYCKHHHIQLFKEKGNYSQLENEREKNPVTVNITAVEIAAES